MVDDDSQGPPVFVNDFPEWPYVLEKVMMLCEDGDIPEYQYIPTIRRGENQEPKLTTEQEYYSFLKEVKDSKGFDISFDKYRCIFNYQPIDFSVEPDTRELMDKLSEGSLVVYNKEKETNYIFDKVEKTNFHTSACGHMYFITFEAKQPSDDEPKLFRAKVHYSLHYPTQYIYCDPKPEEKETEEKDPKKPRYI